MIGIIYTVQGAKFEQSENYTVIRHLNGSLIAVYTVGFSTISDSIVIDLNKGHYFQ